jgi:hypothetical protein
MGAMKYVPGDMRRKEMLYMGCSFENFSWKIEKRRKQIANDGSIAAMRLFLPS